MAEPETIPAPQTETPAVDSNTVSDQATPAETLPVELQTPPDPDAWIKSMRSIDLLALPYCDIPYQRDVYEKALVVLYARGWRFFRIFFVHFFLISPLFWPLYLRQVKPLGWKTFVARFPLLYVLPLTTLFVLYKILEAFDYGYLFNPLAVITLASITVIYFVGAFDDFRHWTKAHVNLSDYFDKTYKKRPSEKKTKTKKKKTKGKANSAQPAADEKKE